jgi:hypothetical protein
MGRGLSTRQKRLLALLVVSKKPLDVGEAAVILGEPETRSARVSMLESVRGLERRGLITIEKVPEPRGGWPRMLLSARAGADGELTAPDLWQARNR